MEELGLSKLYKDIEYSDDELIENRELFAGYLHSSTADVNRIARSKISHSKPTIRQNLRSLWGARAIVWSMMTASALTLILSLAIFRPNPLDNNSLEEIQLFVASNGDYEELMTLATELKASNSEITRLNGLLVLSMLGTNGDSRLASAQGLIEDPRDEYRIYYLEYLLENANEDYYNVEYVENLMLNEDNPEISYLLEKLLHLARLNSGAFFI